MWQPTADVKDLECMAQWSLGWIIEETDDKVVVALTLAGDRDAVSDKIVLPKGCVLEIVEVKI